MSKKRKSSPQPRTRKTTYLKYVGHGGDQERATLLERILDAFVSVDSQWCFTYVNHHAEALLGNTREELLGRNVWEVFPIPADSVLYRNAHEALEKQTGLVFQQFHPLLNKWFDIRLYPFQDGLYSFCQDITERKKAEERLQFQADTSWEVSKSIIVTDLQGKIAPGYTGTCSGSSIPGGTVPSLATVRAARNSRRRVRATIRSLGPRFSKSWSVIPPMLSVTAWSWPWMLAMPV